MKIRTAMTKRTGYRPTANKPALLLLLGALFTLLTQRPGFALTEPRRPPNIVLIFADDLGYGDLGCYGAGKIKTPNLDRLAREGVKLTQFYACAPVCTPSRAGLLTGRYPIRTGLVRVLSPGSKDGIDDGEATLAEALRARGYATTCIGKWHLGHLPPFLPTRHGFDRYFGIPYSNDMDKKEKGHPPTPLMRGEAVVEAPARQETLTRRYTEEAIAFIRESKDRPFFLYLPHTFPHVPLFASERFRGKSQRGLYGDVVEELDWSVGQILAALKDYGRDRDTLVLFTSDNGPWLIMGENGGSAGALRDGKTTVYEGGVRVPFLARWPGQIPAGRVCEEPAISVDLFPTLLGLAGGKPTGNRPVDGKDVLGLLTGKGQRDGQDFYFYNGEALRAIRSGRWKLLPPREIQGRQRPNELYDLLADPGESKNLADASPEIVQRLTDRARAFDEAARKGATAPKR
jgi:arylsulfatase A-like enzyme